MLEIKSRHLTWGWPKYYFRSILCLESLFKGWFFSFWCKYKTCLFFHYFSISRPLLSCNKNLQFFELFFGSLIPDSHRFQHSQQILFCVNQMCISFQMKVFYFLYYPNIERQIKFYQNPFIFLQSTVKSHIFLEY